MPRTGSPSRRNARRTRSALATSFARVSGPPRTTTVADGVTSSRTWSRRSGSSVTPSRYRSAPETTGSRTVDHYRNHYRNRYRNYSGNHSRNHSRRSCPRNMRVWQRCGGRSREILGLSRGVSTREGMACDTFASGRRVVPERCRRVFGVTSTLRPDPGGRGAFGSRRSGSETATERLLRRCGLVSRVAGPSGPPPL